MPYLSVVEKFKLFGIFASNSWVHMTSVCISSVSLSGSSYHWSEEHSIIYLCIPSMTGKYTKMSSSEKSLLDRVFTAKSKDESRQLYDQWASSYDADMQIYSFTAPQIVAEMVPKYLKISPADATVVDAGCGSGLVGVTLHKSGFNTIDGLDLSEGMLKVAARTGAYRKLEITDLTKKLDIEDSTYDALTCSGTFTHGHVGPEPLPELTRIVKAGGILVATVLESFWKEENFEQVVKGLEESGTVEVLENNLHHYRKFGDEESGGLVLVLRIL